MTDSINFLAKYKVKKTLNTDNLLWKTREKLSAPALAFHKIMVKCYVLTILITGMTGLT